MQNDIKNAHGILFERNRRDLNTEMEEKLPFSI